MLILLLRSSRPAWERHAWHTGHALCAHLLERRLQKLRVDLTAELLQEGLHLADLHILQVLTVGEQLGLISQHLRRHAPDHGLRVSLEVLLVVISIVATLPVVVVASLSASVLVIIII